MKRILIIDTETTGLNPGTDSVIEVGAILYSVEHATALQAFAALIHADANPAEAVNRIPPAALTEAHAAEYVWDQVRALVVKADAVVAHRADFDRAFVPAYVTGDLPWICSKSDILWPKQTRPESSLVQLALEHDLGVAVAHRALADCDLIARLFTRAKELGADLNAMLARAMRPKVEFVAVVSYDDREKAKAAGFRWEAGERQWRRRMPVEDAAALPFPTRQVAA